MYILFVCSVIELVGFVLLNVTDKGSFICSHFLVSIWYSFELLYHLIVDTVRHMWNLCMIVALVSCNVEGFLAFTFMSVSYLSFYQHA